MDSGAANKVRETLLRLPEVEARTGLKKSTIYLRMRDGTFPPCLSLGGRTVAWSESSINTWISGVVAGAKAHVSGGEYRESRSKSRGGQR